MEDVYHADRQRGCLHTASSSSGPGAPNSAAAESTTEEKKRETRRRTKTGCLTCRKRRIKCDEAKPECIRCVKSKRTCEGYNIKTVFRNENQLHYQQNIRPSPIGRTTTNPVYPSETQHVEFSIPQYHAGIPGHEAGPFGPHIFATPQISSVGHGRISNSDNRPQAGFDSRNSSASNASGVSANSEQRRISVLSLMSSDQNDSSVSTQGVSKTPADFSCQTQAIVRSAESDARDNYYYNYYISCHAFTLAKSIPISSNLDSTSRESPSILWSQTVPGLINDDPPGCRPLFDAVIAYTAHSKFEEVSIDYQPKAITLEARLLEVSLKAYTDIIRGTAETIGVVDMLFETMDHLSLVLRWGLLQHVIVNILADAKPRVLWINFLCKKAFSTATLQPGSEVQHFYLRALQHVSSNDQQMSTSLLDFRNKYEFLCVPGMDTIYFAFIQDFDALRNIAYHVLSNPRPDSLYAIYRMIQGGRLRGESDLELLADELLLAIRQI